METTIKWISDHYKDLIEIVSYIIAAATVIVRVTPTLNDDNKLLPIIKFIAKYIALNRSGDGEVRQQRRVQQAWRAKKS